MDLIRVVLADDHPFMRKGIRSLLQKTSDIEVVGEAENGYDALRLVSELEPDVLLLDMEMPGMNGLEVARELEISGRSVAILAISAHQDLHYILGVLSYGAAGYLTKEELPETVEQAVRSMAHGEQGWVSERVADQIAGWVAEMQSNDEME